MEQFRKQPESLTASPEDSREKAIASAREILNEVDEEALFYLIADEVSKAGVDSQNLRRLIPISEVTVVASDVMSAKGSYSEKYGIRIKAEGFVHERLQADDKLRSSFNMDKLTDTEASEVSRKTIEILKSETHPLFLANKSMSIIKTLIHEELHALTDNGFYLKRISTIDSSGVFQNKSEYLRKVGFETSEGSRLFIVGQEDKKIDTERFTGINEAVTEIKARKLARAYLESHPPEHVSSSEIAFIFDNLDGSYTYERFVCEQLFILFATLAEVPVDVIENAFFKAYLENEHFLPAELVSVILENSPELEIAAIESLLNKLEIALSEDGFDEESDVSRIFKEVIDTLPEEKRSKIKDAFGELYKKYNPEVYIE